MPINEDDKDHAAADPYETLHLAVKKDTIDACTFDQQTQADLMQVLVPNLEFLEASVYSIRGLLREPDVDKFC